MRIPLLLLPLLCSFAGAQTLTAVRAARLFDGKSNTITQPGVVVISGNKIQSVGGTVPSQATVIDVGDATLLPGFIDAHTHLTMAFNPDYNAARLTEMGRTIPEQA